MFLSVPWNLQNLTELILSHFMEMEEMFSNCHTLTTLDLTSFYTSKVTNMSSMFSGCSGLTSLDLSTSSISAQIHKKSQKHLF